MRSIDSPQSSILLAAIGSESKSAGERYEASDSGCPGPGGRARGEAWAPDSGARLLVIWQQRPHSQPPLQRVNRLRLVPGSGELWAPVPSTAQAHLLPLFCSGLRAPSWNFPAGLGRPRWHSVEADPEMHVRAQGS